MEAEKEYALVINKKIYKFECTDGEEHVNALKHKIMEVIEALSFSNSGHILSDYAMKIVILLADDAVRAERTLKIREDLLVQKCRQLLTIFE
jgi:hypothetical protein